jgi:hypothetical protein
MLRIRSLCVLLLASDLTLAQSSTPGIASSIGNPTDLASQVVSLQQTVSQMQKQLAAQEREIETLKAQSTSAAMSRPGESLPTGQAGTEHLATNSSVLHPELATGAAKTEHQAIAQETQEKAKSQEAPLGSFKVAGAELQLGGFVDFENIFRTTNTQNNIATGFAAIPYSNTPQGQVTEFRSTAQYSRLSVKVTDQFRGNDITGYVEADFSGNDAPSVYQSVNPHTNRLRLFFGHFKRGKWEILGGQTWSWLTPNRKLVGPWPSELALTYNEDQNIGVGIPYTRAAEFRVAYHPNEHWAFGVGIEDPNQFIGNYVALPVRFTEIGSQFDNGANAGAANRFPDILSKVAYDGDWSGRHFHAEITGFLTGAQASVKPIGESSFKKRTAVGGGGQIAANYDLIPKLTLLVNAFWSDGGAHYLVATGPQLVVRPNAAGTDVSLSMVHAGAGSVGLEWKASSQNAFAAYYALDYFGRNSFPDTTNTTNRGTIIGFGGSGSPNTNNRTIQQYTFDWIGTLWKHPKYGAVQFYTQYSYLTRAPWFMAPSSPQDAHLSMVYAGVRYVLPTTSGRLTEVPIPY